MREKRPSQTALVAAEHRAAHQLIEQGCIFRDPLALIILGRPKHQVMRIAQTQPGRRPMRLFIASRSAFAEASLETAIKHRNVRQLVILGAGLDTLAYRSPLSEVLKVFEVDYPATQAWKRRKLRETGIAEPESLTYVPADFEQETLLQSLKRGGFDPDQRSFFIWLGVVPYLSASAVDGTLKMISSLPGGAEMVFDYSQSPSSLSPRMRAQAERRAARVAELGEPFQSYFEPEALLPALRGFGLTTQEDLGPKEILKHWIQPTLLAKSYADIGGNLLAPEGWRVVLAATA